MDPSDIPPVTADKAPAITRAQATSWRNAVFVVFGLSGLAMATWVARVPAIRDHLEISTGQVGILIFGMSAGSIIGLVVSSHVLHWLGARLTLVATLSLVAIGLVVIGFASTLFPSFPIVFIGLALFGAGQGMCDVAMNVEGAAVERASGRTIMPLFHAFWSFGTVIGAALGALAVAAGLSVFAHLGIFALVVVVGVVVAVRFLQEVEVSSHEPQADGAPALSGFVQRLAIWGDGRILLIGLIVLGAAFAEGTANDWLALAMVDDRDVSQATGALLFGLFTAAMTVGRIAGVPILDRFGRVPVLRGSALLAVIGLGLVIVVPHPAITVIGIVLWGLGSALGFPVGMSAAADDPAKAAAGVSAVATIGYAAFLVGPPLIGMLGQTFGLLNSLTVVLALIFLAGLAAPAARPPRTEN